MFNVSFSVHVVMVKVIFLWFEIFINATYLTPTSKKLQYYLRPLYFMYSDTMTELLYKSWSVHWSLKCPPLPKSVPHCIYSCIDSDENVHCCLVWSTKNRCCINWWAFSNNCSFCFVGFLRIFLYLKYITMYYNLHRAAALISIYNYNA